MKNFNKILKEAKSKPKKKYGKNNLHSSIDATKRHKHSRSFLPQIPNISIVKGSRQESGSSKGNLSVVDEKHSQRLDEYLRKPRERKKSGESSLVNVSRLDSVDSARSRYKEK